MGARDGGTSSATTWGITACLTLAVAGMLVPPRAGAQPDAPAQVRDEAPQGNLNAEARVYFERGNRLFEKAMGATGEKRTKQLERALQNYVASLRIVRSRNVLFNAGLTLQKLDRPAEAYGYFSEYLQIEGLTEAERNAGRKRRTKLRDEVLLVQIDSEPAGATVHVDRRDLAPHGRTPATFALEPGTHTLWLSRDGYETVRTEIGGDEGEQVQAHLELEVKPVSVRIETPGGGEVWLDGERVDTSEPLQVDPGDHHVRVERDGRTVATRDVQIEPGAEPVRVTLTPASPERARLAVATGVPEARVHLDGERVGRGHAVEVEVAPGRHRVRVEAPNRDPWKDEIAVKAGGTTTVHVSWPRAAAGSRFGLWPWGMGAAAAGVAVAALGVSIRELRVHDEFGSVCGQDGRCGAEAKRRKRALKRKGERLAYGADGLWAASGALAITTLVLALLEARSGEGAEEHGGASASFQLAPARGGVFARAEVSFGEP